MRVGSFRGQSFEATQQDIDTLKNEFWDEARMFSYFRKGEWHGILASIDFAEAWAAAHPLLESAALLGNAFLLYPRIKEGAISVAEGARQSLTAVAKTLCFPVTVIRNYIRPVHDLRTVSRAIITTKKLTREEESRWGRVCGMGTVARIPEAQRGSFTYLVNERRWAIFTRLSENELRGIIGEDKSMRDGLTIRFLREFIAAQETVRKSNRKKRRAS